MHKVDRWFNRSFILKLYTNAYHLFWDIRWFIMDAYRKSSYESRDYLSFDNVNAYFKFIVFLESLYTKYIFLVIPWDLLKWKISMVFIRCTPILCIISVYVVICDKSNNNDGENKGHENWDENFFPCNHQRCLSRAWLGLTLL